MYKKNYKLVSKLATKILDTNIFIFKLVYKKLIKTNLEYEVVISC